VTNQLPLPRRTRKIEDIQSLTRDVEEASTRSREYQHKNDQLTEKVAVIIGAKAEAETKVAVLSRALEDANIRLKASQDKMDLLTDENKMILQEKAVIQGQFKQLQSSLP
jgi:predicted transcriptional regulator